MFDIAVNVVGWKPHLETSPKSTYTPAWLQLAHKGGRMSSPEVRTLVWELICNLSNIFHHIEGRCLPLFKGLFFNATFFFNQISLFSGSEENTNNSGHQIFVRASRFWTHLTRRSTKAASFCLVVLQGRGPMDPFLRHRHGSTNQKHLAPPHRY